MGKEMIVEEKEYPIITLNMWDVRSILGFIGTVNEIEIPEEDMRKIAFLASDYLHDILDDDFWDKFRASVEEAVIQVWSRYNTTLEDGD